MRKSNCESIRCALLSKTLSGFHLHHIWSRPRASALRDNLSFSLLSAHHRFFCYVDKLFFVARRSKRWGRRACACRTRILVGQSGAQEQVATDLIYEEIRFVCR
jgi:hypothetical protein